MDPMVHGAKSITYKTLLLHTVTFMHIVHYFGLETFKMHAHYILQK